MDRLWAPWRSAYLRRKPSRRCIFCVGRSTKNDARRYIIRRSAHAFSMLNRYPYSTGHLMVSPYRHVSGLGALSPAELADLMRHLIAVQRLLDRTLRPQGYNIGLNLGRTGGAGVTGHIHIHVVPRWAGDTNFMPVVSATKVVSESLEATYAIMTPKRSPCRRGRA